VAKATYKMPEEFLMRLSKLGEKTDEVTVTVLKAGAEVVESKVRSNLSLVIGKNTKTESRSTGQLLSALGVSEARQDRNGDFNIKVGFAENRTDGISNAMLANILEYGKQGQPAKPFLKPAKISTQKTCIDTMIATFYNEADKL
jgi:HK97 gp10 family phage protein